MLGRSTLLVTTAASLMLGCAAPPPIGRNPLSAAGATTVVQKPPVKPSDPRHQPMDSSSSNENLAYDDANEQSQYDDAPRRRGQDLLQVRFTQSEQLPSKHTENETPERDEDPPNSVRPAYALNETLPIDLPTVIRLVDGDSPSINFARARVREATARRRTAELQWLPDLSVGSAYNRYDGQTQNQRGEVFSKSRSNLFGGAGVALGLDLENAIYGPLIERRLESAEQLRASAELIDSELEAVLAYLDLVQLHSHLVINAETLEMAKAMLEAAKQAREAKLDRTAGDVNRAQAEVLFRRNERLDLQGRSGAASARLGRLLLLNPNVKLEPVNPEVVPITLIGTETPLDEMIAIAIESRPDLAANREFLAAAWDRVRKAEKGPLLPKLILANQGGTFGGGINGNLQNFDGRNVITAQLSWELDNLGFGNRWEINARRAGAEQVRFQLIEVQARLTAEIVEASQLAAAKYESLALAEAAIGEATELYRITKEGTFNVVDTKNLFDALRPLQAIQLLNQSRVSYLTAVLDFNRAQYRLYAALGYPPYLLRISEVVAPGEKQGN